MSQPRGFRFRTFEALVADFEGARPRAEQRFLLEHLPGGAPVIEAGGSAIGFFGKITGMLSIKPGQSSSDHPEDEHPKSEQWLFVISGIGKAKTNARSIPLKPGSLLVIEKNEAHQITNTGKSPMATLNLYVPPAYTKAGDVKTFARIPTLLGTIKRMT